MVFPDLVESMAKEPIRFGGYLLEKRLAVGGMSEVYLARSANGASSTLVIKRMLPGVLDDPASQNAFAIEAKLHTAVRHPNVVEVYEAGEVSGEPYLAMEYVPGADAFRLLRKMQADGERLPSGVAIYIAREVCKALACIHRLRDDEGRSLGIVHRDVTPSNIYLSENGDVKLGDFGIARSALRNARPTASHVLKGKYSYLAPEQVAGESFDHRVDLFSLSVVLTEMIIGRPLFSGAGQLAVLLAIRDCRLDALHSSTHLLPPGLLPILERGLAKSPDQRISTADELYAALAEFELPLRTELRADLAERVRRTRQSSDTPTHIPEIREVESAMRALRSSVPPPSSQRVTNVPTERPEPDVTARVSGPGLPDYSDLLSQTSMLDVLAWVLRLGETGALFVAGEAEDSGQRELYFRSGRLVHVASSEPRDLLGEYLIRRGALERAELEMALLAMPMHGGRLDDTLLALGLVDPQQLLRAVRRQGRDRVAELFGWEEGRVSFYRGASPENIAFPLDLDIPQIMLAGLDSAFPGDSLLEAYREKLESTFAPVRPPPDHAKETTWPASVLHVLVTLGVERRLGEALDELHATRGMSPNEALRALMVGIAGGVIAES